MAISGQHGGNVLQMAAQFHVDPKMVLDFSANINPMGLPDSLQTAIIEHLTDAEQYPDIEYTELHQAIAFHIGCDANFVLAGNGATELIFLWVHYFRPRRAMIIEPTFAEYRRALERYECDIESYPLLEQDNYQLTEAFLNSLNAGLDCLFLCTPNNPTGLMPEPALLEKIIIKCQALNIALFVDESFIDFLPHATNCSSLLSQYSHLYVLRSLTKFYAMPGLRLGYLLSSDISLLNKIRDQREPWTINTFAALSADIVLNDDDYNQATYTWLAQEQRYLFDALNQFPSLSVLKPSANYIFFTVAGDIDLQSKLMGHQILIRSCANYPQLNQQHYRIAIKSHQDNMRLIEALNEVLNG